MRTLEEIMADIDTAASIHDHGTLQALAQELQAIATPEASAGAWHALAVACMIRGDHTTAFEQYRRAQQIYEEVGDHNSAARMTGDIGTTYETVGDYHHAIEHFRRAQQVHEERGDRVALARVFGNMANTYMNMGDYPQALMYMRQALQLFGDEGVRAGVANVMGNIGNLFRRTGDYAQALEHLQQSLHLYQELGDHAGVARVTENIGAVYGTSGDFSKALEQFQKSRQMHEAIGNSKREARILGNIVSALFYLNREDEAETVLKKQAQMEMEDPAVLVNHHANHARLAERRGDLDTAWDHGQRALAVATNVGARDLVATCHQQLRDLAKQRNDFEGYIKHNDEYLQITEEIKGKKATERITMLEAERKMEAELRLRDKERALLYGALPEHIATRLLRGEDVSGDHFDNVSVLFLDIANFTTISDNISPDRVVHLLKVIFRVCDDVCKVYGLTKIKTIGDSYLAVGGVPEPLEDHVIRTTRAALEMMQRIRDTSFTEHNGEIQVRIGLHCGPLVAGIVGEERLQYDIWGDTVNVASRMESTGEPGKIHVSERFALLLSGSQFPVPCSLVPRGEIEIKGKGPMTTYWLEHA